MPNLNITKLNSVVDELNLDPDNFNVFIETGTCDGNTIKNVQPYFENVYTIEIKEDLYKKFNENNLYENVKSYLGDSVKIIPEILSSLTSSQQVVFWLDAHKSGKRTGKNDKDVPLYEEIENINEYYQSNEALILIDDFRLFGKIDVSKTDSSYSVDWSDINEDNILKKISNFNIENYYVYDDMLVIYIKRNA
jgi:hypothetical protein